MVNSLIKKNVPSLSVHIFKIKFLHQNHNHKSGHAFQTSNNSTKRIHMCCDRKVDTLPHILNATEIYKFPCIIVNILHST